MTKKRKRHQLKQIESKLRDAEVILNAGKSMEECLTMLVVSEANTTASMIDSLGRAIRTCRYRCVA